jgi:hypothetical protein
MGVCQAVAALADALAASGRVLTPQQELLAYLLRAMPLYSEVRRLDAWESACLDVPRLNEGDQSPVGRLLDAVFALGRYNLYAAFDESGTRGEFSDVARQFAEASIPVPAVPDLSDW